MTKIRRLGAALVIAISAGACSAQTPPSGRISTANPATAPAARQDGSDTATAEWLSRLNSYRQASDLSPVSNDASLSEADLKHARYMIKNYDPQKPLGLWMHQEDPSNPLYTREGDTAGRTSDVIPPFRGQLDAADALDSWLTAPFHALAMLDPELKQAGYGQYCENGFCAAVLNVGRGQSWMRNAARLNLHLDPERQIQDEGPNLVRVGAAKHVLRTPILFPPNGSTISKTSFSGREWPNPLSACPGYAPPTGLILVASFGTGFNPEISDYSLTCGGRKVDACLITGDTYTNTDETQQHAARADLNMYAAAFLIPRQPLTAATCNVSITRDRAPYTWSFKIGSRAPIITE